MSDLFAHIGSCSEKTENEVLSGKLDGNVNVFMFLRAFGFHEDTVHFANVFNGSLAPPQMIFHSMHALIENKRRRMNKWPKLKTEFDPKLIDFVIRTRHVSKEDAIATLRCAMKFGGLDEIQKQLDIQGDKPKRGRK